MDEVKQGLLKQTQAKIRDGTAINPISVVVESVNQGGFHTRISMRDHVIVSDQPYGFTGTNKGPKPSELVLAALAACQETTWRIYAEDMGITIDKISVTLTGTQDLRGFMSLDKNVPSGFTSIEGEVHLETRASEEELEQLQIVVDQHCPVLDDLTRPVSVNLRVNRIGPASG
ncbi:MAG: Uncharacterised protein [SAR116 cluster bacterium MED-G04]|jgi:putative redox protein|nr:osmotically inducible protein OsmC [SAR116 cluster bacterium]OUW36020.1 MAG: hypothetical protein CBD43_05700 [Gammaproteobacteria bacterium TMED183]CAI8357201.1 MAG: Uncharacterised protein [SAR116 cluster bacterium MED-G04]HCD50561.1 osmotically inducible protein OsmC [Alphaproteobacteria bacterium]HCV62123.1 osmotically inducible protein OsmC [Alphaproteobacteria bacterium]|tara:strand:- start:675 stop:1193 length:519 start_codon:yes stop_codon:yes gene_type:complete